MAEQLLVISGAEMGRVFSLRPNHSLAVGRGQESETRINDPRMSRVHFRINWGANGVELSDNNSTGGTFVGNERVTQVVLRPGDVISAGDTKFQYQQVDSQHATIEGGRAIGEGRQKALLCESLAGLVGTELAGYRLDRIHAMGNSAMVFQGTELSKDRAVAMKVLIPDLASSEEQKERFVRAMKVMLPVRHPNIVRIYNAGKKGPYCWAAMEFVEGENLAQVIDRIGIDGMLDWREVWRVAMHITAALAEANEQKIVHRNLTPRNILRRASDKTCLLGDLMLAKGLQGTSSPQLTRPGQMIGELSYMSPEQTNYDEEIDFRSDFYGLGATLYALLTGRPPVEGHSLGELVLNIRKQVPVHPKQYQLSVNDMFADVVLKLLEKRPEDRFQTPSAVYKELDRIGRFSALVL